MNSIRCIFLFIVLPLAALSCGGGDTVSPRALKLFQRGKEAFLKKELTPASALFQSAVNDSSGFANAWVMLGKTRFFLKDTKGAEKALNKAVSIAPSHVEARYYLSRLYLLQNNQAKAVRSLQEILWVDPDNARANYSLGSLYARSRKLKEAFHYFNAALREESMMARIRYTYADQLYQAGLKNRARKILTPALSYPVHPTLKEEIKRLLEKLK